MGLRLLPSRGPTRLYCSTSEVAFGPLFQGEYEALAFLNYYAERYPGIDVRALPDAEIERVYRAWQATSGRSTRPS